MAHVVERGERDVGLGARANVGHHEQAGLLLARVVERDAHYPRDPHRTGKRDQLGRRAGSLRGVPDAPLEKLEARRRKGHVRDLARLLEPHDAFH
ncbi:MAG: hypothetical protein OHK0013_29220 [Sandaracinaceae bacterium]